MNLYTVQEAARELRVSVSFLQHLAARRGIGFTRLGRRSYFSDEDLTDPRRIRVATNIDFANPS